MLLEKYGNTKMNDIYNSFKSNREQITTLQNRTPPQFGVSGNNKLVQKEQIFIKELKEVTKKLQDDVTDAIDKYCHRYGYYFNFLYKPDALDYTKLKDIAFTYAKKIYENLHKIQLNDHDLHMLNTRDPFIHHQGRIPQLAEFNPYVGESKLVSAYLGNKENNFKQILMDESDSYNLKSLGSSDVNILLKAQIEKKRAEIQNVAEEEYKKLLNPPRKHSSFSRYTEQVPQPVRQEPVRKQRFPFENTPFKNPAFKAPWDE